MKNITLYSRYGDKYIFKAINDNTYFFDGKQSPYMRVCQGDKENHYEFIDPDGGPFINIGFKFDNDKIVTSLEQVKGGINIVVK